MVVAKDWDVHNAKHVNMVSMFHGTWSILDGKYSAPQKQVSEDPMSCRKPVLGEQLVDLFATGFRQDMGSSETLGTPTWTESGHGIGREFCKMWVGCLASVGPAMIRIASVPRSMLGRRRFKNSGCAMTEKTENRFWTQNSAIGRT